MVVVAYFNETFIKFSVLLVHLPSALSNEFGDYYCVFSVEMESIFPKAVVNDFPIS